jgi:DNA-binding NarL/FixJ family response regulator
MTMGAAARSGKADTVTVFLVDDHSIVRHGLASYLSATGDLQIVGEAADGAEAVAKITQLMATDSAPDVVLLDLVMPVLDGVGVGVALQKLPGPPRLIILSGFGDAEHLRAALQAGVSGYILKSASAEAIADAIREVNAGSLHLDPTLSASLTKALTPAGDKVTITMRERDVVALVAKGHSNKAIAAALYISERTARTHVSHLLGKLGLASRIQLAIWAHANGFPLASPDELAHAAPGHDSRTRG